MNKMNKIAKKSKASIFLSLIFVFCSMIINVNAVSNTETANILPKENPIVDLTYQNEYVDHVGTSSKNIVDQLSHQYLQNQIIPEFLNSGEMLYSYTNDSTIDYYLFQNSSAKNNNVPLIVWLHGSGERNVSENVYLKRGWIPLLKEWNSDLPNAYILCPQITSKSNYTRWNCKEAKEDIELLINRFIEDHDVDISKIYIAGHSLGAQGALYLAKETDLFAACVAISPYNPGNNYNQIAIPTRLYVGQTEYGEDGSSVLFANKASDFFGKENCFSYKASHGSLPTNVFLKDIDNNNRSDVFEWMFSITK